MTMPMTLRARLARPLPRRAASLLTAGAGLALSLLLAACGGGGGGGSSNPAPSVSIAFAPASAGPGKTATLTWSSSNASSCTASNAWSGSQATSGTLSVTQTAIGSYAYALACTGSNGTATATATLTVSNTAALTIDTGPSSLNASNSVINVPYVSVTVCKPGSTAAADCQTIDHVMVDTGSYGLRLVTPLKSGLTLPSVTTPSGVAAGECAQFVSGYAWGSVRQADITIGGESASAISVQVVGDTSSAFATAPSSCTNTGSNLGTVAALGANGVLGLGLFKQDCGADCVNSIIGGTYYACNGSTCSPSRMALASQVSNPAAFFALDNNGVIIDLPSVAAGGATTLSGNLIFGVGTQSNNALSSQTVYKTNTAGNFTTTYNGVALGSSFIDSGSNGLFFDDSAITPCSGGNGFFCPSSTLSLSAVNAAYDGSTQGTVPFTIVSLSGLADSITAANIGGGYGNVSGTSGATQQNGVFDWGLPFFFGRKVFVVYENSATTAGTGPYWAY